MRFLAELVYLRSHGDIKSWPALGKLFWIPAKSEGLVMLNGIPFPCAANQFSGPMSSGIRIIGRAKDSDADPAPYIDGDIFATVPTWESPKAPCKHQRLWCGHVTSTPGKEQDGSSVVYTLIIEVIPVIWTREFRGLWLEVTNELQDKVGQGSVP